MTEEQSNQKKQRPMRATDMAKLIAQSKTVSDALRASKATSVISQAEKSIQDIPAMSKQLQEALKSIDAGRIALPRDSLWDIAYSNAAKLPPLDILQPSAEILKTLDAARISLPKPLLPPPINGGIAPASYGGGEAAAEPPARESATRITSSGDLGRLIRKAREDRNLSQQSFADLAGVGRRFVSELENGKATLEFDKVLKVAHAAGISIFAKLR